MANQLQRLSEQGVAVWVDSIARDWLEKGELRRLRDQFSVVGVTSNPTIFQKAMGEGSFYDDDLARLARAGLDARAIFERLALHDIRAAAADMEPLWQRSGGVDGRISFELPPDIANDTDASVSEARRLFDALARPNVFIKIPATAAGVPAVRASIADGINVNVTLIFSIARYREVIEAYLAGLEDLAEAGGDLTQTASVASFFVSRVDSNVDEKLQRIADAGGPTAGPARTRLGTAAIDNAKLAYEVFEQAFSGPRWPSSASTRTRSARSSRSTASRSSPTATTRCSTPSRSSGRRPSGENRHGRPRPHGPGPVTAAARRRPPGGRLGPHGGRGPAARRRRRGASGRPRRPSCAAGPAPGRLGDGPVGGAHPGDGGPPRRAARRGRPGDRRRQLQLPRLRRAGAGPGRARRRLPRRRHLRRRLGRARGVLPDGRRAGRGGGGGPAGVRHARAAARLGPRRPGRRGPLRQDGPQRHRVRPAAGLRGRLRGARRDRCLRLRPAPGVRGLAPRQRGALLAARPGRRRLRQGPEARQGRRLRGGLRRGPLDGRRGAAAGRARAGDQPVADHAAALPRGRVLRRQVRGGAAQRVRRPRGEGRRVSAANPLVVGERVRATPPPTAMVIFGGSGDLAHRKIVPALYNLELHRLLPQNF